jgi:hypothetical protein
MSLTNDYINDGFAAYYTRLVTFVTWRGFHVGFGLRSADSIIFTIPAFNKIVKRMHAVSGSEEILHQGFLLSSLIPAKLRKGIDYFTVDDSAALTLLTLINMQGMSDYIQVAAATFWAELVHHTTAAKIAFSQDDERRTILFPFNYWSLRQLGRVMLGEYVMSEQANWSWLTLTPNERKDHMLTYQ